MASGDIRRLIDMIKDQDGEGSGLDADLLRGLPADFTCSKTESGYTKLPNGLIIQWGRGVSESSGLSADITFPVVFPNAVFIVIVNDRTPEDNVVLVGVYGEGITNSKFQIYADTSISSFYWIAIGY